MHLVATFGKPAPASFVPEGTGSKYHLAKLLKYDFRFLFPTQKTQRVYFAHTPRILRLFEESSFIDRVIDSRPELSSKYATNSHSDFRFKLPVSNYARDHAFALQGCQCLSKNSRSALSGKVATISYIEYQIQIARFPNTPGTMYSRSMAFKVKSLSLSCQGVPENNVVLHYPEKVVKISRIEYQIQNARLKIRH
ncbi:hypothetical protein TNCV_4585471 [Trichonephila clavipes]|nr:hypothetical protein TNCV_4585471 [Trichonephila clavipes]